jgi:7-carboxy-7-deazaguanine synthase
MSYAVKEIFLTLQGEGMQAGRRAVFLRFAGCNLWSGRERDRASADCTFCDTDFVGTDGVEGGRYEAEALAAKVEALWGVDQPSRRLVVITGGEPMLQLDGSLIGALHARGFEIAVETNGTLAAPDGIDWLCVSPKAGTKVVQRSGDELKLVWPQSGIDPEELAGWDFDHFLIQPMDGADKARALEASIAFVMAHPGWELSLQTHKWLGLP